MNKLTLTGHAAVRMAQRGVLIRDAELIPLIGTEVDDGFLVRTKDCQHIEREMKRLLDRIWRMCGKLLIVQNGQVVTAYQPSKRRQRQLIRNAYEHDLYD